MTRPMTLWTRTTSIPAKMVAVAWLVCAAGPALATASEGLAQRGASGDHSQHEMDHSQHGSNDAMPPANADPHAHHRAMMAKKGYQRSEHAYQLSDVRLVSMSGEETSLARELNGDKPVMVNFIFTTCTTICPVMSATFRQVQSELGPSRDDVRMISVSIDPEFDTPERLRDYAKRFESGPQWQFLTGRLADSIAVQKAFDVYGGNKMNHEPTTLLRRSQGEPWVRLDGIASAAEIVNEYRQLVER